MIFIVFINPFLPWSNAWLLAVVSISNPAYFMAFKVSSGELNLGKPEKPISLPAITVSKLPIDKSAESICF